MSYSRRYDWFMRTVMGAILGRDKYGWPLTDRIVYVVLLVIIAVGVWR